MAAGIFFYAQFLMSPTGSAQEKVSVDIPLGSTASSIARILKQKGLIRSEFFFLGFARLYGAATEMKAGEYSIPRSLGLIPLIDKLVAGDAEQQWVAIPEGKTVSQVAVILEGRRLGRSGEFLTAAARYPKRYDFPHPVDRRSVEGYLLPDTYKFAKQVSERTMIRDMLRSWHERAYVPNQALFQADEYPVDKIVIMASLIEREARVPEDRPLIAAVIRNRLKRKMPLQIDATVIYALGRHKNRLTFADLKVDSPYNTYKVRGLPPGPICSPGLACIEAALKPAEVDYLYYVAKPDGSHIFTRTLAEHNAAVAKARAMAKGGQ